jgi:hypothetical protein
MNLGLREQEVEADASSFLKRKMAGRGKLACHFFLRFWPPYNRPTPKARTAP